MLFIAYNSRRRPVKDDASEGEWEAFLKKDGDSGCGDGRRERRIPDLLISAAGFRGYHGTENRDKAGGSAMKFVYGKQGF